MTRYLLTLAALALFSPLAHAQDVVSYDPRTLAGSFIALATFVTVATQAIKVNVLEKKEYGFKTKPGRWVTLTVALLVSEGTSFVLQFVLGGITDPQFATVSPPALQAAAYGFIAFLASAGFVAAARSTLLWGSAALLTYKGQRELQKQTVRPAAKLAGKTTKKTVKLPS